MCSIHLLETNIWNSRQFQFCFWLLGTFGRNDDKLLKFIYICLFVWLPFPFSFFFLGRSGGSVGGCFGTINCDSSCIDWGSFRENCDLSLTQGLTWYLAHRQFMTICWLNEYLNWKWEKRLKRQDMWQSRAEMFPLSFLEHGLHITQN